MQILKPLIMTALAGSLAACATGGMGSGDPIARLEQRRAASPQSEAVNRALGIAYYKAGRFADARAALTTAVKADPRDGTAALYLGLASEELGDYAAARTAYSSYIQYGRTSRVRSQLQSRLAALTQKQIAAEAKSAVAQEATMAGTPGNPRTVAVLPLRFTGADSSLRPLERGFAELLTTDLARSSQLTVVERARTQALLDEITLQTSGATDAASNVRAGKLVRAGRVVQGSLNQVSANDLRVDAAVVDVPTSQIQGTTNASAQIEALFDLEKKVALDLFTQLGVTLTPAERNLIEQRPTRSLQAFLAYSRGLTASDEGRYDDAGRFFNEAARIDPNFGAAQQKGQEAQAAAQTASVTGTAVEANLKGTNEGVVVSSAAQGTVATDFGLSGLGGSAQSAAADLNPSAINAATSGGAGGSGGSAPAKDPVSAGTNSDNVSSSAKVTIVVKRPSTP